MVAAAAATARQCERIRLVKAALVTVHFLPCCNICSWSRARALAARSRVAQTIAGGAARAYFARSLVKSSARCMTRFLQFLRRHEVDGGDDAKRERFEMVERFSAARLIARSLALSRLLGSSDGVNSLRRCPRPRARFRSAAFRRPRYARALLRSAGLERVAALHAHKRPTARLWLKHARSTRRGTSRECQRRRHRRAIGRKSARSNDANCVKHGDGDFLRVSLRPPIGAQNLTSDRLLFSRVAAVAAAAATLSLAVVGANPYRAPTPKLSAKIAWRRVAGAEGVSARA